MRKFVQAVYYLAVTPRMQQLAEVDDTNDLAAPSQR